MITQTIDAWQFRDHPVLQEAFTTEARNALFDFYCELSDCTGEPVEFDPIAFRCEWSEYHVQELWDDYSHVFEDAGLTVEDDSDDYNAQVRVLEDRTRIIDIRRDTHMGNILVMEF